MNKEGNRFHNIHNVRWVGMAICITVAIWSIWPSGEMKQSLTFQDQSNTLSVGMACPNLIQLINSQVTIQIPRFVRYMDSDVISLTIIPGKSEAEQGQDECAVVLEVNLDIPGLKIEPGAHIFLPLTGSQQIRNLFFQVTGDQRKNAFDGNIWIYANITANQNGNRKALRVPLYVIPVEIKLKDLFGIPYSYLKFGSLLILLLLFFEPKIRKWLK